MKIGAALRSGLFLAALVGASASAEARKAAPARHPAPDDASDDEAEGGEAPDGADRAPQGTGHGRGKGGEEGVLGDVCGVRPFLARYGVTFDASETSFEATYQAWLAKGAQLQPDLQYVIDPAGGHVARDGRVSGDALVLGLRTTITF